MSIFLVGQPDYDSDNIDSAWSTAEQAKARAEELGRALINEYSLDATKGWVRNGWWPPSTQPAWNDFGQDAPSTESKDES